MTFMLEKRIWTEKDFPEMSWHDNVIYLLDYNKDLTLDIDYILAWNQPEVVGFPFTFWIAPATLVFKSVKMLSFALSFSDGELEIDDIEREDGGKEDRWTIITRQGSMQFHCSGFDQYIRQDPFLEFSQRISCTRRNGYCLDRTTEQENPNLIKRDVIDQRSMEVGYYELAKQRQQARHALTTLTQLREEQRIDLKSFLLKKRTLNALISSYNLHLKHTDFEHWGD